MRHQAEEAAAQALARGNEEQRAALAQQFHEAAAQAAQQPGEAWQALAARLQALAAQLAPTGG